MDQLTRELITALSNPIIAEPLAELILDIEFPDGHRETQHCRLGFPISAERLVLYPIQGIGPIRFPSPTVSEQSFQSLTMAIADIRCEFQKFVSQNSCKLYFGQSLISLRNLEILFFGRRPGRSDD